MRGMPRWVSLATGDPTGSQAFYTELFGWNPQDERRVDAAKFVTMLAGGEPVAGVAPMFQPGQPVAWTMSVLTASEDAQPSVWMVNVFVADVAATVTAVIAAGGEVLMDPWEAWDIGRLAVVADPAGAILEIFEPAGFAGSALLNEPSAMAWTELDSCDPAGAIGFYREVFGWEATQLPHEPHYWRWDAGGVQFGGLTKLGGMTQAVGNASHWLVYFRVSDVDATLALARDLGACIVAEPTEASGARFAALTDPYGATFAVSQPTDG